MKKVIRQMFFISIAILLSINFVFSQEKKAIFQEALWIKSSNKIVKKNVNEALSVEELKKYFNFNLVVDFSKDKIQQKYKNLVTKDASLFVVFRSTTQEENNLFSLERSTFKSTISNLKIICDKEIILNSRASKKGVLISYIYNKNSIIGKKKGNLTIDDWLYNDKEAINQLVELIYIPNAVGSRQKEIIETYLSLKYGISLNEGQNYYNSKGDTIWNAKQNIEYNKRVTGIGKDEQFDLNQKQSKNALEDGLTIGLNNIENTNLENDVMLNDNDFLLWADNGKNTIIEKNEVDYQKSMKRIWRLKTCSKKDNDFKTQIRIDKKQMPIEISFDSKEHDFIWLAIDNSNSTAFNYENATYIKASSNNESEIIFDGVDFKGNSDYYFTFIKSKENPTNQNSKSTNANNSLNQILNKPNEEITLYPNPTTTNGKFTIQFNLIKKSNVNVQIDDANGRVIKTKNLGSIDSFQYTENLPVSGTYLVLIYVNDKLETRKLIIK